MRHPLDAFPRYALVVWKDGETPCCITRGSVNDARQRGALVIAEEWERVETPEPQSQADGDPGGD